MQKNPKLGKHSHNNRESREGMIFRFIREARKLSLKDAALKLNLKTVEVDHFENGRKFYSEEDIKKFLACYDFSHENFSEIMKFNILNRQMVNHFISKIQN